MQNWESFIKKTIEHMGFHDYKVEVDAEHRHGVVFINDNSEFFKEHLPGFVESMNQISQVVAKKFDTPSLVIDINNYRKERENIITELARAAARKAVATKQDVILPAMNSYERRIIHVELASRPDVKTESQGLGKERCVTIKPMLE